MGVICDQLLRVLIDLFPEAQVCRAARTVIGRMGLALMFRQCEQRGVPAVTPEARRIVYRKAEIVSDFRPGETLRIVLVKSGSPLSRWIDLRKRGQTDQRSLRCNSIDV